MRVTQADYGFLHSIGSDFGFCCGKLMRIINLIHPNSEFVLNAFIMTKDKCFVA